MPVVAGVRIGCDQCVCIAASADAIDVRVPVSFPAYGIDGVALLRCHVSGGKHAIELAEWTGAPDSPWGMERVQQEMDAALQYVADMKLCGNKRLCPYDVNQLVGERATRN